MAEKLTPYRQVAKEALQSWNGLSEEEADKMVKTLSYEELENQVWATDSMKAAIDELVLSVFAHWSDIDLTDDVVKEVYSTLIGGDHVYQTEDDLSLNKIVGQYLDSKLNEHPEEVLNVLQSVHDAWTKGNAKKFNQAKRANKRYQHLPMELIGWKEAKADLLFVKPILESVGVQVDEKVLETAYTKRVQEYLKSNHLNSRNELAKHIEKGTKMYGALTEGKNTTKSGIIIEEMIDQVYQKNPVVKQHIENQTHFQGL